MKNKNIFIEFSGVAGVGKTRLLKEIKTLLIKENVQFIAYSEAYREVIKKKMIYNIKLLIKSLYIVFMIKPKSFKYFISILKHIILYQMFRYEGKNKGVIQIYDEGVFRIAAAVTPNRTSKDALAFINTMYKYLPKPDILVNLEAKTEIVLDRRRSRKRDDEDNSSYEELLKRYKEENSNIEKMLKKFEKEIEIINLEHNEKEDILKNAHKIVSLLKTYQT